MVPRLVVAAGEEIGPCELQPHPGQVGPSREDRLESLGGAPGHAELHLDLAEEEEPLDPFLVIGGPRLLQERPCVLQPAGPDEKPAGLHVGELGREPDRSGGRVRVRSGRDQKRDRGRGARGEGQRPAYCCLPPWNAPPITRRSSSRLAPSTPPTSSAAGP